MNKTNMCISYIVGLICYLVEAEGGLIDGMQAKAYKKSHLKNK